ncbi:MAG: hypothetical protein R3F62_15475 [Planctomycetota bacterium]
MDELNAPVAGRRLGLVVSFGLDPVRRRPRRLTPDEPRCQLELYRAWGPGLHEVVVQNTLGRAGGGHGSHARWVGYYVPRLLPNLLPAGLFFLGGAAHWLRRRRTLPPAERFAYEAPLLWLGPGSWG